KLYRKILIASQKGNPLNRITLPNTPFRTTNEMLDEFSFLGEDIAEQIVVTNSNKIANKIEDIAPIKDGLFTPSIEGAEEEVRNLTYHTEESIYGTQLPDIVENRLQKESNRIIINGSAITYLISNK